ncbi:MAG TPA: transcriptional regulator [Pseudonocardiaceae bacterium]|nr:transcriptional regulator [Pseudonocardiaceae bacterium]
MTEDWAAVSRAIIKRMTELSLKQSDVITVSRVSKAIVGEIQHNTVQRRRSERTLVALSEALQLPPNYLDAVLKQRPLPRVDAPVGKPDKDVPGRLTVIENELRQIHDLTAEIKADVQRIIENLPPPA